MEHLKGSDWAELRERYPAAYNFLLHRELKNEKEALKEVLKMKIDSRRYNWVENRIADLERWE